MIWTEPPPFSRWVYTFSTFWWHCGWLRQGEAGGEGVELRKRQTGLVPCADGAKNFVLSRLHILAVGT